MNCFTGEQKTHPAVPEAAEQGIVSWTPDIVYRTLGSIGSSWDTCRLGDHSKWVQNGWVPPPVLGKASYWAEPETRLMSRASGRLVSKWSLGGQLQKDTGLRTDRPVPLAWLCWAEAAFLRFFLACGMSHFWLECFRALKAEHSKARVIVLQEHRGLPFPCQD